jgi:hypothetical protein
MTTRASLPSSVIRVFQPTTKDVVVWAAVDPPGGWPSRASRTSRHFRHWFVPSLDKVANCVLALNPSEVKPGIHPGNNRGHSTKILALFVRDIVLFSRYFSNTEVETIVPCLYCPVNRVVVDRLRRPGERPGRQPPSKSRPRSRTGGSKTGWARWPRPSASHGVWFDEI